MSADAIGRYLEEDAAHAALFLDFDGTLAPIVEDPATATAEPRVLRALPAVAERLALVAVVSGRPVAFLAAQLPFARLRLLGLYGLEEWRDGRRGVEPEVARWEPVVERARSAIASALAGVPGVRVEDKGLGLGVHWRQAGDRDAAAARVAAVTADVARETGLRRDAGKLVVELRPPVERDKGAAVAALAEESRARRFVYIGDDVGDVPALAAVRARGGLAVAVDHGPETPRALLAAADVVLDGVDGVVELLERLATAG